MKRDPAPTPAAVAMASAQMMTAARVAATGLADPAAVWAAIRGALVPIWPTVPPEAARDVLVLAAETAWDHGIRSLPAGLADQTTEWLLEMTGDCRDETARLRPGSMSAPAAFASSVAFDRDEDLQTFESVAVVLALAMTAEAEPFPWECPRCHCLFERAGFDHEPCGDATGAAERGDQAHEPGPPRRVRQVQPGTGPGGWELPEPAE